MENNKKWLSIVLAAIIVMSVCAVIPAMAQPTVTRVILPSTVSPGDSFLVTIWFTAPQDIAEAVIKDEIQDQDDWNVNIEGVTPAPLFSVSTNNMTSVIWGGEDNTIKNGENVTVMYRLTVPNDAEEGDYNFVGKLAETNIWDDVPITGANYVTVEEPSTEKSDLVITEKWVCWPENCTICYNITNIGNGTAPADHNTTLFVDGTEKTHDQVTEDLVSNASYIGCFEDYTWEYTPTEDNITVCADNNKTVDESDEDNNCLTNIWVYGVCGDVTGEGDVTGYDDTVLALYIGEVPGWTIKSEWAADVNGDGYVTGYDEMVLALYIGEVPGWELNCMCSG